MFFPHLVQKIWERNLKTSSLSSPSPTQSIFQPCPPPAWAQAGRFGFASCPAAAAAALISCNFPFHLEVMRYNLLNSSLAALWEPFFSRPFFSPSLSLFFVSLSHFLMFFSHYFSCLFRAKLQHEAKEFLISSSNYKAE